jgi:hypothetical protein
MLLLTYSRALLTHEAAESPTEFNSASQDSKEAGSATERVCGSSSSASSSASSSSDSSTSNAGKDREGRREGGRGGERETGRQGSMEGAAGTKWKVKKRARPTNAASVSGTLGLSFFFLKNRRKTVKQRARPASVAVCQGRNRMQLVSVSVKLPL